VAEGRDVDGRILVLSSSRLFFCLLFFRLLGLLLRFGYSLFFRGLGQRLGSRLLFFLFGLFLSSGGLGLLFWLSGSWLFSSSGLRLLFRFSSSRLLSCSSSLGLLNRGSLNFLFFRLFFWLGDLLGLFNSLLLGGSLLSYVLFEHSCFLVQEAFLAQLESLGFLQLVGGE